MAVESWGQRHSEFAHRLGAGTHSKNVGVEPSGADVDLAGLAVMLVHAFAILLGHS